MGVHGASCCCYCDVFRYLWITISNYISTSFSGTNNVRNDTMTTYLFCAKTL
jgi:hypothetical protein